MLRSEYATRRANLRMYFDCLGALSKRLKSRRGNDPGRSGTQSHVGKSGTMVFDLANRMPRLLVNLALSSISRGPRFFCFGNLVTSVDRSVKQGIRLCDDEEGINTFSAAGARDIAGDNFETCRFRVRIVRAVQGRSKLTAQSCPQRNVHNVVKSPLLLRYRHRIREVPNPRRSKTPNSIGFIRDETTCARVSLAGRDNI